MLNLDTHILLFALAGKLTKSEEKLLNAKKWGISSIVLWEISKLSQLGRIELDINDSEFSLIVSNLQIWPLDLSVCRAMQKLDFSSDPADEIIAATSIVHRVPLVTRDKKIRKSKLVKIVGK